MDGGVGRVGGLDDPPSWTRTLLAARITSGRPGPPVAPRPAGWPHSDPRTRQSGTRNSSQDRWRTTVGAMRYPDAERLDLVEDLHGHSVADPYRWLEDPADPRTQAWTAAQDALTAEVLGALPMRADFAARLEQLVHAGAVGVPVWRG